MSISSDSDSDWGQSPPKAKKSKLASKIKTPGFRTSTQKTTSKATPRQRRKPSILQSDESDEDFRVTPTSQGGPRSAQKPRLSLEEKQFQKQLELALRASTAELKPHPEVNSTPEEPEEDSTAPLSCSLSPLKPPEEPPALDIPPEVAPIDEKEIESVQVENIPPTKSKVKSEPKGKAALKTRPDPPVLVPPTREPKPKLPKSPKVKPIPTLPNGPSSNSASTPPCRPSPSAVQWKPPRLKEGRGKVAQEGSSSNSISPGGSSFRPRVGLSRNIRGIKPLHAKVSWKQS